MKDLNSCIGSLTIEKEGKLLRKARWKYKFKVENLTTLM